MEYYCSQENMYFEDEFEVRDYFLTGDDGYTPEAPSYLYGAKKLDVSDIVDLDCLTESVLMYINKNYPQLSTPDSLFSEMVSDKHVGKLNSAIEAWIAKVDIPLWVPEYRVKHWFSDVVGKADTVRAHRPIIVNADTV